MDTVIIGVGRAREWEKSLALLAKQLAVTAPEAPEAPEASSNDFGQTSEQQQGVHEGLSSTVLPAKQATTLRLTYTHEAMIDLILREPSVRPGELATLFERSPGWISRILNSDSFQARLAERKSALVDPSITRALNNRFRSLAIQSTQVLQERLDAEEGASLALDALSVATSAMRVSSKAATR